MWRGGGVTAAQLFPAALERRVAFVPGAPFYAGTPDDRCLRLSFVTVPAAEIDAGIRALGAALRSLPRH